MKLKRCPYCNSHELTLDCSNMAYWVRCHDCGATGPNGRSQKSAQDHFNGDHCHQNPSALVRNRNSNRSDLKEIQP